MFRWHLIQGLVRVYQHDRLPRNIPGTFDASEFKRRVGLRDRQRVVSEPVQCRGHDGRDSAKSE